jgi:hypothetical protein
VTDFETTINIRPVSLITISEGRKMAAVRMARVVEYSKRSSPVKRYRNLILLS